MPITSSADVVAAESALDLSLRLRKLVRDAAEQCEGGSSTPSRANVHAVTESVLRDQLAAANEEVADLERRLRACGEKLLRTHARLASEIDTSSTLREEVALLQRRVMNATPLSTFMAVDAGRATRRKCCATCSCNVVGEWGTTLWQAGVGVVATGAAAAVGALSLALLAAARTASANTSAVSIEMDSVADWPLRAVTLAAALYALTRPASASAAIVDVKAPPAASGDSMGAAAELEARLRATTHTSASTLAQARMRACTTRVYNAFVRFAALVMHVCVGVGVVWLYTPSRPSFLSAACAPHVLAIATLAAASVHTNMLQHSWMRASIDTAACVYVMANSSRFASVCIGSAGGSSSTLTVLHTIGTPAAIPSFFLPFALLLALCAVERMQGSFMLRAVLFTLACVVTRAYVSAAAGQAHVEAVVADVCTCVSSPVVLLTASLFARVMRTSDAAAAQQVANDVLADNAAEQRKHQD